ncbi:MAG: hypothetical protein ACOCRO_03855 [Halanaerobiales bacterium]
MAGNTRQIAVIPINYSDRELAKAGELIIDDEGRLFSKLNDGTVKPIKGEQLNFLMDLFKHMWHIGEDESLDYDLSDWIKTGDYDPSIDYTKGSILLREFYLDNEGEELERWRAISPVTHLGHVVVDNNNGRTLRELFDEDLAEGFISMSYRIDTGDLQYISSDSFSIEGDWVELFIENRKLKLITDGGTEVYTLVSNSTFDDTKTIVTLKEHVLVDELLDVLYSIVPPGSKGPTSDIDIYDKISSFLKAGHNIDINLTDSEERLEISTITNSDEVKNTIGNWIQDGGATTVNYDSEAQTLKISSVNTQRSDSDIRGVIEDTIVAGDQIEVTYNSSNGTLTIDSLPLTGEEVQDIIGATIVGENNIDVSYNDPENKIVIGGLTDNQIKSLIRGELNGYVRGVNTTKIVVSSSEPSNMDTGDIWIQ